jgi:NAD(P)H-hydrate epimerase
METVLALRRPGQPLVVDADGLYWLATQALPVAAEGLVLTPHPGEAARLLGSTSGGVQADRRAALQALLAAHRGIVVLKGAGTLVGGGPDPVPALCDRGNPGMAVAGMGDVLAGAVAGILAQGCPPRRAAEAAVLAHALAGDLLAGRGQRGLLAGDLALALTDAVNQP